MLLADLVRTSAAVSSTRSRTAKTGFVAEALAMADDDELEVVAAYLAGAPRQRRLGVGWRGLSDLPPPAEEASLGVSEVDAELEAISRIGGTGSKAQRAEAVASLVARATEDEQHFLRALIFENLRQGALDSILLDAIAKANELPVAAVRQAAMFTPSSVSYTHLTLPTN